MILKEWGSFSAYPRNRKHLLTFSLTCDVWRLVTTFSLTLNHLTCDWSDLVTWPNMTWSLTLAGTDGGGGGWCTPLRFSQITRVKSGLSQQNFKYPRVNQFYTYSENFMTLTRTTFDLLPTFRNHVWWETRFGVCRLALAARLQSFRGLKRSDSDMMLAPCTRVGLKVTWRSGQVTDLW